MASLSFASSAPERAAETGPRTGLRRVAIALVAAGLAIVFFAAWAARDNGRIFAGVRAAEVSLGGLTPQEAVERLREAMPATGGRLQLVDPRSKRVWDIRPDAYGAQVDAVQLAEAAWQVGRQEHLPRRWLNRLIVRFRGYDVLAGGRAFDPEQARAALEKLAPLVDTPPRDAAVWLERGELQIRPPEFGHQLDIEATLRRLGSWAERPISGTLELAIARTSPRVYDLSAVALAYRRIISGPVHLVWRNEISRTLTVAHLRRLVTIEQLPNAEGGTTTSIVFDTPALTRWVAGLGPAIDQPPRDARFDLDPATGLTVRVPARMGVRLNVAGTVQRVIDAAYTLERLAVVDVELIPPRTTEAILGALSEVEELSRAYTSLKGLSGGRLKNVYLAAQQLQGVVIPVGETLSLNGVLGEVSAGSGYDMPAIDGAKRTSASANRYLDGGLTQLATTLFRAAAWAGLPIPERHPSPYRLGWLEPPIGFDAAIDGQRADLRIRNDTRGPVLIQTEIDTEREALAVILFGRRDGRQVRVTGPSVSAVTPAGEAIVLADRRVPVGQHLQVGWAREGAVVTVVRTVRLADGSEHSDTWESSYEPAADVFLVGR